VILKMTAIILGVCLMTLLALGLRVYGLLNVTCHCAAVHELDLAFRFTGIIER